MPALALAIDTDDGGATDQLMAESRSDWTGINVQLVAESTLRWAGICTATKSQQMICYTTYYKIAYLSVIVLLHIIPYSFRKHRKDSVHCYRNMCFWNTAAQWSNHRIILRDILKTQCIQWILEDHCGDHCTVRIICYLQMPGSSHSRASKLTKWNVPIVTKRRCHRTAS